MKIKRIHSLILKNVKIFPKQDGCFLHNYELLGLTIKNIEDEFENNKMIIYNGDFTQKLPMKKCPWCDKYIDGDFVEHIETDHNKTLNLMKVLRFQEELYREKLRLLRGGLIDHSWFVYTNYSCQHCVDKNVRGKGLCSVPESARNKTRSLNIVGLTADNLPEFFKKIPNIGYLIGRPWK